VSSYPEIRWTEDYIALTELARHPRVYPSISDDTFADPMSFSCFADRRYVGVFTDKGLRGYISVKEDGEAHLAFHPDLWGRGAVKLASRMIDFIFENSEIEDLWACVFDTNLSTIRLIQMCGATYAPQHDRELYQGGALRRLFGFELRGATKCHRQFQP